MRPLIFVFSLAALAIIGSTDAADVHWNTGSGVWGSASAWNPAHVPLPADNAIVDYFNGGPGRASINASNLGGVTSVVVLNDNTVAVTNGGTLLCGLGGFIVGKNNFNGTLRMVPPDPFSAFTAGLTISSNLELGLASGGGTVTQNGGTINVASDINIGASSDPTSSFGGAGK